MRKVNDVLHNYTDIERKVRKATSGKPYGAAGTTLAEIADATYDSAQFPLIMSMIWKRLNEPGKYWRHVYKGLVLLEYIVKVGSDQVAIAAQQNLFAIQTLKDFRYIDVNDKDQGQNVREKSKKLVALLRDPERLKEERVAALQAHKRFRQGNRPMASPGYRGGYADPIQGETAEDVQLELAMELSKVDADEDERRRREREENDPDFQAALALSKVDAFAPSRPVSVSFSQGAPSLLDFGTDDSNVLFDPLASSAAPTQNTSAPTQRESSLFGQPTNDPFGSSSNPNQDVFSSGNVWSSTTATANPWSDFTTPAASDPWPGTATPTADVSKVANDQASNIFSSQPSLWDVPDPPRAPTASTPSSEPWASAATTMSSGMPFVASASPAKPMAAADPWGAAYTEPSNQTSLWNDATGSVITDNSWAAPAAISGMATGEALTNKDSTDLWDMKGVAAALPNPTPLQPTVESKPKQTSMLDNYKNLVNLDALAPATRPAMQGSTPQNPFALGGSTPAAPTYSRGYLYPQQSGGPIGGGTGLSQPAGFAPQRGPVAAGGMGNFPGNMGQMAIGSGPYAHNTANTGNFVQQTGMYGKPNAVPNPSSNPFS